MMEPESRLLSSESVVIVERFQTASSIVHGARRYLTVIEIVSKLTGRGIGESVKNLKELKKLGRIWEN